MKIILFHMESKHKPGQTRLTDSKCLLIFYVFITCCLYFFLILSWPFYFLCLVSSLVTLFRGRTERSILLSYMLWCNWLLNWYVCKSFSLTSKSWNIQSLSLISVGWSFGWRGLLTENDSTHIFEVGNYLICLFLLIVNYQNLNTHTPYLH